MTHTPHMPLVAVPEPETTQIYDAETSWQKPWPHISPLLYKAPFFSFGPFLFSILIALVVGIGSAYLSLNRGSPFSALESGVWVAHPHAGTVDSDPYSTAIFARTGRVPLGSGEGIAFYAAFDDSGRALDPQCNYRIAGRVPATRLWTITALNNALELLATDAGRASLHSHGILTDHTGAFAIQVSPEARPGNWLPTGGSNGLVFAMRLYDIPYTTGAGLSAPVMPAVELVSCK
ncbi:hypothetical protein SAMN05444141_101809 [Pseudovibrio denitrificans]|uniref:DUF1214 domain-containing protein n=1 Tax=Pseudovibrio denitrificans TaxID=258256 RepID=A0A1I6YEC2_9HYPH|nr:MULTISPECIES: DUF1214 domain-containing protein [Pseudovibrio]SFT48667.1 hypothetical protein SAMN05444141_101809 [Pseudovibrio denitrificans]